MQRSYTIGQFHSKSLQATDDKLVNCKLCAFIENEDGNTYAINAKQLLTILRNELLKEKAEKQNDKKL